MQSLEWLELRFAFCSLFDSQKLLITTQLKVVRWYKCVSVKEKARNLKNLRPLAQLDWRNAAQFLNEELQVFRRGWNSSELDGLIVWVQVLKLCKDFLLTLQKLQTRFE